MSFKEDTTVPAEGWKELIAEYKKTRDRLHQARFEAAFEMDTENQRVKFLESPWSTGNSEVIQLAW